MAGPKLLPPWWETAAKDADKQRLKALQERLERRGEHVGSGVILRSARSE